MSGFKVDFVVQRSGSKGVDYDILALNFGAQWGNDLEAALISKLLILMSMLVGFNFIFQEKVFSGERTNLCLVSVLFK